MIDKNEWSIIPIKLEDGQWLTFCDWEVYIISK